MLNPVIILLKSMMNKEKGAFLIEAILSIGLLGLIVVLSAKIPATSLMRLNRIEQEFIAYQLAWDCINFVEKKSSSADHGKEIIHAREYYWTRKETVSDGLKNIVIEVKWEYNRQQKKISMEIDLLEQDN